MSACRCQLNWFGVLLWHCLILQDVYPCKKCVDAELKEMAEEKKKYGRYLTTGERE